MSLNCRRPLHTLGVTLAITLAGCKGLVTVSQPIGIVTGAALNASTSAIQAFYWARQEMFGALGGTNNGLAGGGQAQMYYSESLTDEFVAGVFSGVLPLDARAQTPGNEPADFGIENVLPARSDLLLTIGPLEINTMGANRAMIGEAFALVGYGELFLAEDYCAGVTLSQALPGGGIFFGSPLSTDSLLGTAVVHFDSALAYASGNDTVTALASVGLGRAQLDLGNYAAADTAVATVSTDMVYNIFGETDGQYAYEHTMYEDAINAGYSGCSPFEVADQKGGTGLNFISAHDPRLTFNTTLIETCDGLSFAQLPDSVFHYPTKFGSQGVIPLMTGIEAQLIQAEAALPHNGGTGTNWLTILNTLRNGNMTCTDPTSASCSLGTGVEPGQTTGLYTLTDPGTDSGEVSLLFRERAFWLYGTGTRQGDLRRLIRQYGRPQAMVFPTGVYPYTTNPLYSQYVTGIPLQYGTDVSLLLPTNQGTQGNTTPNPHYVGCTAPTSTA